MSEDEEPKLDLKESDKKSDRVSKEKNSSKVPLKQKKIILILVVIVAVIGMVAATLFVFKNNLANNNSEQTAIAYVETTEESDKLVFAGETDKAIELWESAIESTNNPDEKAYMYSGLSGVYVNAGDPQKALDSLQEVLELDSNANNFILYADLTSTAIMAGENELAIQYTEKAIENLDKDAIDYEFVLADYQNLLQELKNE